MSTNSVSSSMLDRLRQAGLKPENLTWFNEISGAEHVGEIPASSCYFPGETTTKGDTLIDLATGRPIYLQETVPPGSVFCQLAVLKPYIRTEVAPVK